MGYLKEHHIKAICFDIDGTFYPKWKMDIRLVRASLFHIPFALKYNSMRKRIRREDGNSLLPILSYEDIGKRAAEYVLGSSDQETVSLYRKKEKRIFHDAWERSYRNLKSAPGVIDFLKRAEKEGYRMAALSDFPLGVKLQAMGIENFFEFAISSEDIGRFKPSQAPFKVMLDKLGLEAHEVLYVGDSYHKDVLGAKSAGMHTCLIFSKKGKSYNEADISAMDWSEFADKAF